MKKFLSIMLLSFFVYCFTPAPLQAQGRFEGGFAIGEPTGFSFDYQINRMHAVDGAFGFSPADQYRIHADYLWLAYPLNDQNFSLYYGVGGVVGFGRTTGVFFVDQNEFFVREREPGFGARVPLGVSYLIPRSPVNLYMEVAPTIIVTNPSGVGLDGGLGIRFIF